MTKIRKVYVEGLRIHESPLVNQYRPHGFIGPSVVPVIDCVTDFRPSLPTQARKRRRMYRRLPWGAVRGIVPLCWDSNDPNTVKAAFAARLFRRTPNLDNGRLKAFSDFVKNEVAKLPRVDLPRVNFDEWLASRKSYNEERKKQLQRAYDSLLGHPPTKKQCSHIDSFVKSECYLEWKYPRMINSRSDAWKAFAGPWISACEEIVYSHYKEFIKHTPVPERPVLIQGLKKAGRRFFATDFTAFESHFRPEVMEACENALFRHLLRGWSHVELVCRTNAGENRMRTRSGVSATVKGRRMSGDLWTSLGNGFTNLMLVKYIVHCKGGELEGFVEGDDGIFSTTVEITAKDYEQLGFTIKVEEVDDPTTASFCGLVFADSGQIVRDPVKFCQTFGWTQSFINAGHPTMMRLLRAKALSALYEAPNCPISAEISRYALRVTEGVDPLFVADGYHAVPSSDIPETNPSADTRALYADKYGIPVSVQLECESRIRCGDLSCLENVLKPHRAIPEFASKAVIIA